METIITYLAIGLLGGVVGGGVVAWSLRRRQPGPQAERLRRRYGAFKRLRVATNLMAWNVDGTPVTGAQYVANASVSVVDDDGIIVTWPSPLPVEPGAGAARRPAVSVSYSWQELADVRRGQLTAWY